MKNLKIITIKISRFINKNLGIFLVGIINLILTGLYFYNFKSSYLSYDNAVWGTFGDYVGGFIGTIIGALTLFYVYKTYETQQLELKNQEKKLEKEEFEHNFFTLLKYFSFVIESLEYNNATNKNSFRIFIRDFKYHIIKTLSKNQSSNNEIKLEIKFNYFNMDNGYPFEGYFNSLTQILEFINKNENFNIDNFYSDIIKNQFTSFELVTLFYYGVTDREEKNNFRLKKLIEQYSLLERITETLISFKKEDVDKMFSKDSEIDFLQFNVLSHLLIEKYNQWDKKAFGKSNVPNIYY
jgi:hypothetical protein